MNEFQHYQANKGAKRTSSVKKHKHDEVPETSSAADPELAPKKPRVFNQVSMESAIKTASQSSSNKALSQIEFEDSLVRMLIEDMQPMATVERSGFRRFCELLLPRFVLPSRRTACRRLHEICAVEKAKLMESLSKVRWVSTTADLWSAHRRAYMGLTLHYVHSTDLTMVSSALACRRFKGSHTGAEIGKMLAAVFKEFNIQCKVQNVITDNASNFAKAFSLFPKAVHDDADAAAAAIQGDEESDTFNTLTVMNVAEELENMVHDHECDEIDEMEDVIELPPHKRCGNHSLNLVASVDALQARVDRVYQRSYDRAMAKVQALWNAVSRSPKHNDAVEEIAAKSFVQPTCTRWCSEYYAVERIVDIGFEKIVNCQTALGLSKMTEGDMRFLNSFLAVMKPIVTAMKVLEGEADCYLSHMIPTIMGVERKLRSNSDIAMKPLTSALLNGLQSRFGEIKDNFEYRMASILHPKFKLAFLPSDDRASYKQLLLSYVQDVSWEVMASDAAKQPMQSSTATATTTNAINNEEQQDTDEDDIYSFLHKPDTAVDTSIAEQVRTVDTTSYLLY